MQRHHSPHHHLRSKARQFDLFAAPSGDGAVDAPEWGTLPAQTRQTLTSLLVRLILEHASGDRRPQPEEARNDV